MNTENNDNTAPDVENVEAEEISVPATNEVAESPETTVDVDAVQEDEGDEDEQAADLPDARRYKDFSATTSPKVVIPKKHKINMVAVFFAGVLLVVLAVVLWNNAYSGWDSRAVSACVDGVRTKANIPNDFPGGIKAWEESGGKVVKSFTCDNVAHEK